jgi:hypothetical protein
MYLLRFFAPYFAVQRLRGAAINARRDRRTAAYLLWSVLAGVASATMLGIAIAVVVLLWQIGLWWLALPMTVALGSPVIADSLVRLVLVPTGCHRLAYYAAAWSRPEADPAAYALCIAAWASRSGVATAWVSARREARRPLGDGEIAATALLSAARGDARGARELLRSIAMIVECHPAVRELVGEWLACDAAERGAWRELVDQPAPPFGGTAARGHAPVVDDAARGRWPATPLTYLLEGIAARQTGAAGAPGRAELWARWALAPRRRATRALVREALDVPPGINAADALAADMPANPVRAVGQAALPHALAAHLALESRRPTAADLAFTVGAWDAALDDAATRTWLARRALELDAPAGAADRAIRDVAVAVTEELAWRAEAAGLGAPTGANGLVGHGLGRRLRHGRLDALEAAFSRWAERRHDNTVHPAIDEWREFLALWTAYNAAVTAGGLELRRLAFPHAFSKGNHMAAWLWNQRDEYVLSHAISVWLLAEARIVGDTEAIELGHRNCALAVPTRLGPVQPGAADPA